MTLVIRMRQQHVKWICCILLITVFPADGWLQKSHLALGDSNPNHKKCNLAVLEVLEAAAEQQLWALKFLDATSKYSSGQLLGGALFLGQYDECLSISHPRGDFIGQYCLLSSNISVVEREINFLVEVDQAVYLFQHGICVPSVCTSKYVEQILNRKFHNVYHFKLSEDGCTSKDFKFPLLILDYLFIGILLSIILLSIVSTTYDCCLRFRNKRNQMKPLYCTFSLFTNSEALLKVEENGQFGYLHGLKALSMFAIVYGHTAMEFLIGNIFNRADMMLDVPSAKWTTFNNAHNITDTFFVMGAMLIVVSFFREIKLKGGYDFPLAVLKRYLRLTPTYAFLILYTVSVKKYLTMGPLYSHVFPHADICIKNWHWCLAYVQNYMSPIKKCLGHSWYLDVDMQLFWLSPILLYPVLWWPKIAAIIAFATSLAVASYEFYLGIYLDNGPVVTFARSTDHLKYDHYMTHTRSAPWFLGIFLGFVFCRIISKGKDFKLSKTTVVMCWTIFGGIFVLCQIPLYFFGYDYQQPWASLCLAYRRLGWAIGVGWIIIACATNYGGLLNNFLCWGPFSYFSKISYNVYLLHLPIMEIVHSHARETVFGSLAEVISYFILFTVLSILAASLMTIFVEIPCSKLVTVVFRNVKIFPYPNKKKLSQQKPIKDKLPE